MGLATIYDLSFAINILSPKGHKTRK